MTNAEKLIEKAKNKYPKSVFVRLKNGSLSEKEMNLLYEKCKVECCFAYSDSTEVSITYKRGET